MSIYFFLPFENKIDSPQCFHCIPAELWEKARVQLKKREVLFFVKNTKINTGFYISFVRILFGEIVLLHCYTVYKYNRVFLLSIMPQFTSSKKSLFVCIPTFYCSLLSTASQGENKCFHKTTAKPVILSLQQDLWHMMQRKRNTKCV